jgi:hypothetical protein
MSPAELELFLIQNDINPELAGFFKRLSRKVFRPVGRVLKKVAPIALTVGIGGSAAGALGLKSHTIAGKIISKGIVGNLAGRRSGPRPSGSKEAAVQKRALDNAGMAAGRAIQANSVPSSQMKWLRTINAAGNLALGGTLPGSPLFPTTVAVPGTKVAGSVESKDGSVTRSDPRRRGYKIASGQIVELTDAQAIAAGFDPRSAVRNPLSFGAPTAQDFAKARNLGDLLLLRSKSEIAKGASAGLSGIFGSFFGKPKAATSDSKVSPNPARTDKNRNPTSYAGTSRPTTGKRPPATHTRRRTPPAKRPKTTKQPQDVTIGTGTTIAIVLLLVVLAFGGGAVASRAVG